MDTNHASESQDFDKPTRIGLLMTGVLSGVMAFVFMAMLSMLLMPPLMSLFA